MGSILHQQRFYKGGLGFVLSSLCPVLAAKFLNVFAFPQCGDELVVAHQPLQFLLICTCKVQLLTCCVSHHSLQVLV